MIVCPFKQYKMSAIERQYDVKECGGRRSAVYDWLIAHQYNIYRLDHLCFDDGHGRIYGHFEHSVIVLQTSTANGLKNEGRYRWGKEAIEALEILHQIA